MTTSATSSAPSSWRTEISLFSKLAIPMVATSLLQFSLNIVDTAVVGSYSTLELAGLAAGNSVFFFTFVVLQGLFFSLDMIFGELFGQKNLQGAVHVLHSALLSGILLSALFTIITVIACYNFEVFGSTPEIVEVTKPYLYVMALSIAPSLMIVQLQKFNQVFGNAMAFVWLTLAINVVNFILDIVLVHGVEGYIEPMGSLGAGYATIGCRMVALAAAFVISYRYAEHMARSWQVSLDHSLAKLDELLSKAQRTLRMGFPIALQLAAEIFMFSAATILATGFGDVPAGAHQVVLQICSATFMVPLAISSTTSMRVSTYMGGHETPLAIRSGWIGITMATLPMVLSGIAMYLWPEVLLRVFSSDEALITTAITLMVPAALFQIFDGLQVGAAGGLRGIGKVKTPLYSNLVGHYLVGLPLALYLAYEAEYGVWGIWCGLAAGLFSVSIINIWRWLIDSQRLSEARPSESVKAS